MKILLLEDDFTLSKEIVSFFDSKSFQCYPFYDGSLLVKKYKPNDYDLIILDINVPGKNGIEVCKAIRELDKKTPIIMLTAFSEIEDKLTSFEFGADDYLVKPYSIEELILKIEIFLNRSQKSTDKPALKNYTFGSFHFEPENYLLKNDTQKITLTEREASLLQLFLDNPNTVLKREKILIALWGSDDYFLGRSLDVFISRLRKIIKEETHVRIENIPRVGFKLVVE